MSDIKKVIKDKKTDLNPIWIMRQAGRYLPEFREIRRKNSNFINLCLDPNLSEKITLQPIDRFGFDAAIIFSDILMIPYGLGQKVEFKKNFVPIHKNKTEFKRDVRMVFEWNTSEANIVIMQVKVSLT